MQYSATRDIKCDSHLYNSPYAGGAVVHGGPCPVLRPPCCSVLSGVCLGCPYLGIPSGRCKETMKHSRLTSTPYHNIITCNPDYIVYMHMICIYTSFES